MDGAARWTDGMRWEDEWNTTMVWMTEAWIEWPAAWMIPDGKVVRWAKHVSTVWTTKASIDGQLDGWNVV